MCLVPHLGGGVRVCGCMVCFCRATPIMTPMAKLGLLRLHERAAELRRDAWRHASLGVESIKSEVRGAKMRPRRRSVEGVVEHDATGEFGASKSAEIIMCVPTLAANKHAPVTEARLGFCSI